MSETKRRAGTINVYLTDQESAQVYRIVNVLRERGWSQADPSLVIREALACLSAVLRGKSPQEVVRFFVENRLLRPPADGVRPRDLKQVVH
jgi:hypothetical protein